MTIRSGALRHRITIEGLVVGSPQFSASGAPNVDWGTLAVCWASVEPLNGREYFTAQAEQSEVSARIRFRWPGFMPTTSMRITFGDDIYDIKDVINVEMRNYEIVCMAGVGVNLG